MSVARHFGSGVLIGTPTSGAVNTPIEFGVLQEASVDFSFSSKPLTGQFQVAVAIGRGATKITGKAKFAEMNGAAFSQLFFAGVTPVQGEDLWSYNEPWTISSTTVTVAQSATWSADLGVKYAATGLPLTRVASAPTVGQYSVAAGVYTVAAADSGKAILVSYSYTQTTSGSGSKFTITNPLLGVAPSFQIDFYQQNPNTVAPAGTWSLRLFACISTKLSIGSKLEDWTIPEFDFEAYANAANQVGTWNAAA